MHWQKSFDMLTTTGVIFPGQSRHVSIDVALLSAEYVLAAQEVHTSEPMVSLYFPSWHDKHGVSGIETSPLEEPLIFLVLFKGSLSL